MVHLKSLVDLKSLVVDGNPMRSIRRDIIAVGYSLFLCLFLQLLKLASKS